MIAPKLDPMCFLGSAQSIRLENASAAAMHKSGTRDKKLRNGRKDEFRNNAIRTAANNSQGNRRAKTVIKTAMPTTATGYFEARVRPVANPTRVVSRQTDFVVLPWIRRQNQRDTNAKNVANVSTITIEALVTSAGHTAVSS